MHNFNLGQDKGAGKEGGSDMWLEEEEEKEDSEHVVVQGAHDLDASHAGETRGRRNDGASQVRALALAQGEPCCCRQFNQGSRVKKSHAAVRVRPARKSVDRLPRPRRVPRAFSFDQRQARRKAE